MENDAQGDEILLRLPVSALLRKQEDAEVQHRAMEVTDRPRLGATQRASRRDGDWLLRSHDIKGVASCLTLIADELRASNSGRHVVLGSRLLRACGRLMQLGGVPPCNRHGHRYSLAAVLDDVEIFAQTLATPRTRIEIDAPDLPLRGSAEMAVFRILLNLLSNAVRATNACGGGVVQIAVDLASGDVSFMVTNDGTGLTAARSPADRQRSGSGLGLVIAEALANDLGGSLDLRRGRPRTTSLRLTLPLAVFTAED